LRKPYQNFRLERVDVVDHYARDVVDHYAREARHFEWFENRCEGTILQKFSGDRVAPRNDESMRAKAAAGGMVCALAFTLLMP
jgi:hypothetical protein